MTQKCDIVCVFAQRKERYPGEFAPEVVGAVTEFEYDENPEFIEGTLNDARDNEDFVAAAIVRVTVDMELVKKVLFPTERIDGEVKT